LFPEKGMIIFSADVSLGVTVSKDFDVGRGEIIF